MAQLTLFSAPKPFTNPHIATIQRNALRNWTALGPDVEVILIGEEEGMAEAAVEAGVMHLPQVKRNAHGTPLVSSIFDLARSHSSAPLLAYINADILVMPDFLESALQAAKLAEKFLLVGQRYDLDVREALDFSAGWSERLGERVRREGKLHPRGGSDYFIFPRACFSDLPEFAIGRAGWDNWMIFKSRWEHWPTVDATASIQIIHQNHDYSHLPGGQPHYRLPETFENVAVGGGKRTIYTLEDTDRELCSGRLEQPRSSWKRFARSLETFPMVGLRSTLLGNLAFALFHPKKAYTELRQKTR